MARPRAREPARSRLAPPYRPARCRRARPTAARDAWSRYRSRCAAAERAGPPARPAPPGSSRSDSRLPFSWCTRLACRPLRGRPWRDRLRFARRRFVGPSCLGHASRVPHVVELLSNLVGEAAEAQLDEDLDRGGGVEVSHPAPRPIDLDGHAAIQLHEPPAEQRLLAMVDQALPQLRPGDLFGPRQHGIQRAVLLEELLGIVGPMPGTPGTLSTESPTRA